MFQKLMALASVAVLCACGESNRSNPTAPQNAPVVAAPGARVDLVGFVELDGPEGAAAYLRTAERLIALYGHDVELIRNVPGAEIVTNGAWEAAEGFYVQEFRVLTVGGRQVMDGVVIMATEGLALRLSTGTIVSILDAPEALGAHIGARIWLAPQSEAAPAEFGIIAQ